MRAAVWLDNPDDNDQLVCITDWCTARGYDPTTVIRDAAGLADVAGMYQRHEIDVLVVPSRRSLPIPLDIVTVEMTATPIATPGKGRRPRPLR